MTEQNENQVRELTREEMEQMQGGLIGDRDQGTLNQRSWTGVIDGWHHR